MVLARMIPRGIAKIRVRYSIIIVYSWRVFRCVFYGWFVTIIFIRVI